MRIGSGAGLAGADSYTTMDIAVGGWGVNGIEAEATMRCFPVDEEARPPRTGPGAADWSLVTAFNFDPIALGGQVPVRAASSDARRLC